MTFVTVFCAVWHRDPNRVALVAGHRENLRRQTVPTNIVYVFDGADTPPPGLDAEVLVASEPLTIYQAWNLGLAATRTRLVMNLNLDDRLAPDAIEKMTAELDRSGAALVGGDWRICFSRAQTDAVTPCAPLASLPPLSGWPPPAGIPARLGSTRDRNTYGPATLWRTDVHGRVPRYPWRLSDGTAIKTIGDGVFWELLRQCGFSFARLQLIVGNYYSSPREQAEFRSDNDKEWAMASAHGVEAI